MNVLKALIIYFNALRSWTVISYNLYKQLYLSWPSFYFPQLIGDIIIVTFFFFAVFSMESKTLHMLGKCSSMEPYTSPSSNNLCWLLATGRRCYQSCHGAPKFMLYAMYNSFNKMPKCCLLWFMESQIRQNITGVFNLINQIF